MTRRIDRISLLGIQTELSCDRMRLMGENARGLYEPPRNRITVSPDTSAAMQGEDLVHEVIEAINHQLELELQHPAISGLSLGIYTFLRGNPDLVLRVIDGQPLFPEDER